jgi:transcriptional regulator with XRE-family HTH domain
MIQAKEASLSSDVTKSVTIVEDWLSTQTKVSQLIARVAGIRDESSELHTVATELHQEALAEGVEIRTVAKVKESVESLLNELSTRGFSWVDLAKLIGVSIPALRKWRLGEPATGENRRRLAELAATCDLVETQYLVDDVAGWFEVPIASGASVKPADLYRDGRADLLLDWASHRLSPNEVLNRYNPRWRDQFASDFEIFEDAEGDLGLRPRE